jgi:ATP-dependent Clp protease ATP-binding subunit ClpA/ATP-dependent Clp protease ATP-binding subunit ClpC
MGTSELLLWLARAHADAFGTVEAIAVKETKGESKAIKKNELMVSTRAYEQIVLKLTGLGVRDFFEGEAGSHVWQSLGRLPEIVQVRVTPAGNETPKQIIDDSTARKLAFQTARTRGERTTMADPFVPPPVVRTYRFEPPMRANESAPLDIEDYLLGYVGQVRVRTLAEALVNPWLLRRSRAMES